MRENLHNKLTGRHAACLFISLTFLLFTGRAAAQNCSPDTEPPAITLNHPLLQGVSDGDTLKFQCGQQVLFSAGLANATDNCDPIPQVNFTETFQQGNCQTQQFILNMHCCWIANDASGNAAQICIQVVVEDHLPPVIGAVPPDLTVDLTAGDTIPAPASPSTIDGCFGVLQGDFSEENLPDSSGCGYTLVRTWTAADNCGNMASKTQNITVVEPCVVCPADIVTGFATQPANCALNNGAVIAMVSGNADDYQYLLSPSAGFPAGSANAFTGLPPGAYSLTVSLPSVPNCQEQINFNIYQNSCLDTLSVTISQTKTVCLDTMGVLDYPGSITSATFCDSGNAATVEAALLDNHCLTLSPATGFSGLSPDVICVVHCFDNDPAHCDTTYLLVTVTPPPCALAFSEINVTHTLCGLDNGSVEVLVSGAQGTLIYTWSPDVAAGELAQNLAGGDYSITVEDTNGCKIDTIIIVNATTAPAIQVATTPETCTGNDGTITVTVTGGTGNITYSWSPDVSTTSVASGLGNNQTYAVSVADEAGCSNSVSDIAVGYDCDTTTVAPIADIISLVFECGNDSLLLCTYLDELKGNFSSLTICQGPANGTLFPANDTCLLYVPNLGFAGDDSTCVLLCDDLGVCDTFFFEILVEDCTGQIPCIVLAADYASATVEDCDAEAKICLEYDLGEILLYDFFIDGQLYDGAFDICAFDTIVSYGFAAIPGNAMNGPYNLNSWAVNGATLSGTFHTVFEMASLMNQLDPAGGWDLDTATLNIVSYNASAAYGTMTIVQPASGDITTLNLNTTTAPTGSSLFLPVGEHEIILQSQQYAFCVDTLRAEIFCAEGKLPVARSDADTTSLNNPITIDVLANDDINGVFQDAGMLIPAKNGEVQVNGDFTFTYRPDFDFCGIDDFAYYLCNENGCDSAIVFIEISCDRVIVFNGFSPNDDGINDVFKILGLENYPNHELFVFNRWGNEVYQTKNYQNNWRGRYASADLPDGTYFYRLDLGNGQVMKGFVQLNR